ncbi:MAG: hypothetical protein H5T70_01900 [Chloroflexi bacterium]|nr:hypothetical protein [Chloroflexota bacterium]
MSLGSAIRAFRRWSGVILIIAILSAASALMWSSLVPHVYRAEVYLNVWPSTLELGLQESIRSLLRNYAASIASREMAEAINARLQLDLTPEALLPKIEVTPLEDEFLLRIEAQDGDPLIARDIAQAAAQIFVETMRTQMLYTEKSSRVEVSIRDEALPGTLHKPKPGLNALAGGILGALVGGALALWLSGLEAEYIRHSRDVTGLLHLEVLGVIPRTERTSRRLGEARRTMGQARDL